MIKKTLRVLILGILITTSGEMWTNRSAFQAQTKLTSQALPSRPELLPAQAATRRVKPHKLFRPRAAIRSKRSIKHETPATFTPLPRIGRQENETENRERMIERWKKRLPPNEYRNLIERTMTLDKQVRPQTSERVLRANPGVQPQASGVWMPLISGIVDTEDGRKHKAGRIRTAAYSYDNEQRATTLWLGTSNGGLWKFISGRWAPVSNNLVGATSVGAFLVFPGNSNNILIGTGDYYRGAGSGLYRTTNGGADWSLASMSPTPGSFFKIILDSSDRTSRTVLASTENGIWRSTDAGESWRRVYAGMTTDLAQDPRYPRYWYAGAPGIGVLESSDSGSAFHPRGTGITGPIGRVSLTVCAAAPNYVYALVEGEFGQLNNIYRSRDYGTNWRPINTVDRIAWDQAFHTCAISVDPSNPDRLIAGMGGGQRTNNATADAPIWADFDGGHADYTSFLFVPGTTQVVITNDGGYYFYNYATGFLDGSGNLYGLNVAEGYAVTSARTESDLLLAGLQDNGNVRIKGSTARFVPGGDGGPGSFSPDNAGIFAFSSGAAFHRYLLTNRGTNNINCSLGNEWLMTMLIDPTPGLPVPKIFTYSGQYVWYKPVSPDCDWQQANGGHPLPDGFGPRQVEAPNRRIEFARNNFDGPRSYVFYVTAWGRSTLYVMDGPVHGNLGNMNWEDRTPPLPPGIDYQDGQVFADRYPLNLNTVYYTTGFTRPDQPARAYISTDRGLRWRDVTGDLATIAPQAKFFELVAHPLSTRYLFLATDIGIFRSDNGGINWYRYMEGLPRIASVSGIDLNFNSDGMVIYISIYGRGFWKRQFN